METLLWLCLIIIFIIIVNNNNNSLTARVVGAPQMISQPVFSIFFLFSTALWNLSNSRPVHSLILSSHLFLWAKGITRLWLCLPQLKWNVRIAHTDAHLHVESFWWWQRGVRQSSPKRLHTAVIWTRLPFIRSGESRLSRHGEKGKKTRQTHQKKKRWEDNIREWTGLEFAKSQRAAENRKMEETGCEVIGGAPTTLGVKG